MAATAEKIMQDALALTLESRLALAELLVASVARQPDPAIEKMQLEEVRRRIQEAESGQVELIPGDMVLRDVREAVAPGK